MKSLESAASMKIAVLLCVGLLLDVTSHAGAQTLKDPALQVEQFVSGLSSPTTMAFIGLDDILVLQKNDGRVRRVLGGVLQAGEVLDVAVDKESERGLLGIAVHPGFPAEPSVYLYYTESSTGEDTSGSPTPLGNRVYRYTWDGSALVDPTLILGLPVTPGPNHDGGIITFGPDGKLYVVIGDLNRNGQLQNFSSGSLPDDTSVILRINDDGTIPGDNPFSAEGGNLAKYYAYGIRNSFGLSFDPVTDKLWITENGPATFDEINLVEPGFNSGWEQIMGPDARDPQGMDDLFDVPGSQYSDPEFSWFDTVGPTAIVFLNSVQLGEQYQDDVFVGDVNIGTVYHFEPNGTRDGFDFEDPDLSDLVADTEIELEELIFGTGFGRITDLKVGPDGLLYVVSLLGKILRVFSQEVTAPVINVSPLIVDFGSVAVGTTSAVKQITISNTGDTDLKVTAINKDFPSDPPQCDTFDVVHTAVPFTIAPGDSTTVDVTFTPTAAQMFDCDLEIVSDDPVTSSVEVTLWGTGTGSAAVNLTLSSQTTSVSPGGEMPFTVEIENTTGEPQSFGVLFILNLPTGEEVPLGPPMPVSLPPHATLKGEHNLPISSDSTLGECTLKGVVIRPNNGVLEVIDHSSIDFRVYRAPQILGDIDLDGDDLKKERGKKKKGKKKKGKKRKGKKG